MEPPCISHTFFQVPLRLEHIAIGLLFFHSFGLSFGSNIPPPPDYSHVRTSLQMLLPWLKGNICPSFSPDFLPQPGQDSPILFLVPSLVLVGVISIALRRAGMARYFHHVYFCSPCFPVVSSLRNAYFPNFYAIPFPPFPLPPAV